jgi:hypothetical protein
MPTNQLPLHQNTVTDPFTLIYFYVDDYLQAPVYSGLACLPQEPHQKASYAELMTIRLVGDLLG